MLLGLRARRDRLRRIRPARALLAIIAGCLAIILLAVPANAQPRIELEAGLGGWHRAGADITVQVEIRADQLIDGVLRIELEDASAVVLPVELAGGSTKRYVATIPQGNAWQTRVQVSLVDNGTVLATATENLNMLRGDELVGVLPSRSDEAPGQAELSVDAGIARVTPVETEWLSTSPGAFDALSMLVATSGEIGNLPADQREALEQWITEGGTLVIDEPAGLLPGLDIVTNVRPVPYGSGSIRSTDSALAQGAWDFALAPTPLTDASDEGFSSEITGESPWFGGRLSNSLASDAGFDLPPLGVVFPLMIFYILIVGPVAFFLLRRRKQATLLWLVLPAIAAVFTVIVWVAGSSTRSATTDAHGTSIELRNGRATTESTVLRSSRNGGNVGIDLQPGWRPAIDIDENRFGNATNPASIRQVGTATRLEADLDAGEFVTFHAAGRTPAFDDALSATAVSERNGAVSGTVANQLAVDLREVVVFAGNSGINIGTIGAGQTVDFALARNEQDIRRGQPIEFQMWQDATGGSEFGPFGPEPSDEGPVNISLWSNFMRTNPGRVRPLGQVAIVGWTDALSTPMAPSVTKGRTMIVAYTDIDIVDGRVTDLSLDRTLLRVPRPEDGFGGGPEFIVSSLWRFDVPADIALDRLGLELPASVTKLELWNGQEWVLVEDLGLGFYALPTSVVIDGAIHLRPGVNFDNNPQLGRDFSLQTSDADQELKPDLVEAVEGTSS